MTQELRLHSQSEASQDSKPAERTSTDLLNILIPRSFEQAMQFAELISKSDLAPKDYQGKPGNIMVAMQLGAEIGLSPMQALQNIAVINGRPTLWGDSMLGLVQGSGLLVEHEEWIEDDEKRGLTAYCRVRRKGEQDACTQSFSMEDAKQAQLLEKNIWKQYRRRMLQMRARSWALRDKFSDVLKGLQSAEEIIDVTPQPVTDTVGESAEQAQKEGEQLHHAKEALAKKHEMTTKKRGRPKKTEDASEPTQETASAIPEEPQAEQASTLSNAEADWHAWVEQVKADPSKHEAFHQALWTIGAKKASDVPVEDRAAFVEQVEAGAKA